MPPDKQSTGTARRSSKIARDAARVALRNGDIRLALGILIWPPGWSHTRLDQTSYIEDVPPRGKDSIGV